MASDEAGEAQASGWTTAPRSEHRWLQRLVGEWTYEGGTVGEPDGKGRYTGSETVRPLGGLWVVCEGRSSSPHHGDEPMSTLMTLGFDPDKGRYVGTWIGSPMSSLWLYDGEVDASGKVLTLTSFGPSMSGDGSTMEYHDIIEWVDEDHRIFRNEYRAADGSWVPMMSADYQRVK